MAKFFQHLEPGDRLGKVTKLKYVDDISDDDEVFYYFDDGTQYNEDFIEMNKKSNLIGSTTVEVSNEYFQSSLNLKRNQYQN